jgi:hypothetical protein
MKRLIILSAVACTLLMSCAKTNEELLVGTWHATSIKISGVESVNTNPAYTNLQLSFSNDKSFSTSSDAGSNTGTWALSGQVINITSTPLNYSYTIQTISETKLETQTTAGSITIEHKFQK